MPSPSGWPAPYAEGSPSPWIAQILMTLPLALAVLAPDGSILTGNDALKATVGADVPPGARPQQLVVPEDGDALAAAIAEAIATARSVDVRAALPSRPGEKQVITITAVPPGLGVAGLLAMRDIREQLRLEAQVAAVTRMQAVGQLAGGIAHDFNNILTAVLGLTEQLLARHPEGDEDHGALGEIRRNGQRAAALVAQLLAFARQQPQRQQVLELPALIEGLRPLITQLVGPAIDLDISGGPLAAAVHADPGQIEQVIVNLAVNARDAMAGAGTLAIAFRDVAAADVAAQGHAIIPRADHVVIDVIDSGSGIPAAIAGKIFEPFFTTKPMGKGTGLGLSTVYGIVKQSGGYVFAGPRRDGRGGTCFSVYLPAVPHPPSDEAPVAAPPALVPKVQLAGLPILLVEDDTAVRTILERGLKRHGLAVAVAVDGAAALAHLEAGAAVTVLISDIMMPGIDGVELAARAIAMRPGLAVVLMSGFAEPPLHRAAEAQGVRFLAKPFALVDLLAAIASAMAATV